jgi:isoleucyl-tRNA synthetase
MKGNLAQLELKLLEKWRGQKLYAKMQQNAEGRAKYILHDGPPYANGNIHLGHALNKILKDTILKSYRMRGYNVPYVPGWDCHGLPIEWKIEEQYRKKGQNKDEVPVLEFREECRTYAQKWMAIQSDEFQRLGIFGDWENPYSTMTNRSEALIVREILTFLEKGLLYRGVRPVMWSVIEKTALAEAEIEYHDHTSPSVYVAFSITSSDDQDLIGAEAVIWTTTPWTLPGNRGIAYGEDITYCLIQDQA